MAKTGLVIPSYKESANIATLIDALLVVLPELRIVVVDDSPDLLTAQAVEGMQLAQVEVIHRGTKGGRGSAVLTGLRRLLELECEVLVEMDADLSHPPEQLPYLLEEARREEADLLIASRYLPESRILNWPLSRRIFSKAANFLARQMLQVPITDYTNGYRVYSRRAAELVKESCGRYGDGFIALSEILVNLHYRGYRICERSTVFRNRLRGESSVTWRELAGAFLGLWKIFGLKMKLDGLPEIKNRSDWRVAIEREWARTGLARPDSESTFPLAQQSFESQEIVRIVHTLLRGRLTMDRQVAEFEARFAAYVGAPYAVMVNSGSSANLLALAVATNPARSRRLQPGDEVLVPAVCWSTSVWPLLQMGLVPVFVDVDPATLNVNLEDLRSRLTPRTKALMAVHVLGNACDMDALMRLIQEHDLMLVEDTCESLGSRSGGRILGTFGQFGTYSFYYSHHMTTGEGGMVVCHTLEDYDLLRCLRAHGWSRTFSNRAEVEASHPHIDPRFLFVNVGYNLRPMEIQAALGLCQLERLDRMNATRIQNRARLVAALRRHPRWAGQLEFSQESPSMEAIWFGFACLLRSDLAHHYRAYLDSLSRQGVENRPIVSGNFTRQPGLKLMGMEPDPLAFPGAEQIHQRGFFIGLHTEPLSDEMVARLADILLSYEF